jgi:hypothetical protein
LTLAKLQDPLKKALDAAQKDLKPIYAGLNKYGKALDKVWTSLSTRASTDPSAEVQRQAAPVDRK